MITKIAQDIISQHPYYAPSNHSSDILIVLDAIKFSDEDASRLAGPFLNNYGLVYIEYNPNSLPISEQHAETLQHCLTSHTCFPYQYQKKIEDKFGKSSEFWYNNELKQSLSDIDIRLGADTTGYTKRDAICSLFARTELGWKELLSALTEDEQETCLQYATKQAEEWCNDDEYCIDCKERPYTVYLCGNDDASWTKAFSTVQDALMLIVDLQQYGFSVVDNQMYFTN